MAKGTLRELMNEHKKQKLPNMWSGRREFDELATKYYVQRKELEKLELNMYQPARHADLLNSPRCPLSISMANNTTAPIVS